MKKEKIYLIASIVILICSVLAYAISTNYVNEPPTVVETSAYLIFEDGTYTYSKNGLTGAIDFYGTNVTEVYEDTRDIGLTSGRNIRETIKFRGEFTIDSTLYVETYQILDFYEACVALDDNSDCDMIYIETTNVYREYSEIRGGIFYGNKGNQASGHGIVMWKGSHNVLRDCVVRNVKQNGIMLAGDSEDWAGFQRVLNCKVYTTDGHGFYTNYQSDCDFIYCIAQLGTGSGSLGGQSGFKLYYPQYLYRSHAVYCNASGFSIHDHSHLVDCFSDTSGQHGFYGYSAVGAIKFTQCYAYRNSQFADNTYDGFHIASTDQVQLINCRSKPRSGDSNNQRDGFFLTGVDRSAITNCIATINSRYGLYMEGCDNTIITSFQAIENEQHGIRVVDSTNIQFTGCNSEENEYSGLSMYNVNWSQVTGGTYINNDASDTVSYDGINLNTCDDILISGISAYGNDEYQIHIANSACTNVMVSGSRCDDAGCSGNIQNDGGADCYLYDNLET